MCACVCDSSFPVLWFLLVVGTTLTVKTKVFHKIDEDHVPDCYFVGIFCLKNKMRKYAVPDSFLTAILNSYQGKSAETISFSFFISCVCQGKNEEVLICYNNSRDNSHCVLCSSKAFIFYILVLPVPTLKQYCLNP